MTPWDRHIDQIIDVLLRYMEAMRHMTLFLFLYSSVALAVAGYAVYLARKKS